MQNLQNPLQRTTLTPHKLIKHIHDPSLPLLIPSLLPPARIHNPQPLPHQAAQLRDPSNRHDGHERQDTSYNGVALRPAHEGPDPGLDLIQDALEEAGAGLGTVEVVRREWDWEGRGGVVVWVSGGAPAGRWGGASYMC